MATHNKNLSKLIKSTRISLKMTQEEFGKQFNPPAAKSIISRWEKGTSTPSAERLLTISKLSGYTVDELLYGTLDQSIASLMLTAMNTVDNFFKNRSFYPPEFIEQGASLEEKNYLSDMFDFVYFKKESYFGTPKVSLEILNKDPETRTEDEQKLLNDFYHKEYIAGSRYLFKRAYNICFKTGIKPYEKNKIMHILAKEAELKFNDVDRTDEGLISFVVGELDSLYSTKIPNFNYSTNAEGEQIKLSSKVHPELEEKISDMIAGLSEQIYDLLK